LHHRQPRLIGLSVKGISYKLRFWLLIFVGELRNFIFSTYLSSP
jgi:hypothetical protein